MARATAAVVGIVLLSLSAPASAQTLRGSRATMQTQNSVARQHDYSFLRTSSQVKKFVNLGLLVQLPGNADYELARVSFPYARPAIRTFVERLSAQYRSACGERLVVTSLTRPEARQPRNASDLSVHPAGMAVDLRVSKRAACRKWLESTLLSLEARGVVDATRERYPAHYHVAVFPEPYTQYVAALTRRSTTRLASTNPTPAKADPASAQAKATLTAANLGADVESAGSGPSDAAAVSSAQAEYEVRPGDTLWGIARRHGITVDELKAANGLAGPKIKAGQTLAVPAP